MSELATLGTASTCGRATVQDALNDSEEAAAACRTSSKVHDAAVPARAELQRKRFGLPPFPTKTIGSFPQTAEVRKAGAAQAKRAISDTDYEKFLREETACAIHWQNEVGLEVLVHGEFERNDMQYFGEQLPALR
jgi:5-methyltetrahydropteroyltriglutamate--homocysteine methyltransferase